MRVLYIWSAFVYSFVLRISILFFFSKKKGRKASVPVSIYLPATVVRRLTYSSSSHGRTVQIRAG